MRWIESFRVERNATNRLGTERSYWEITRRATQDFDLGYIELVIIIVVVD